MSATAIENKPSSQRDELPIYLYRGSISGRTKNIPNILKNSGMSFNPFEEFYELIYPESMFIITSKFEESLIKSFIHTDYSFPSLDDYIEVEPLCNEILNHYQVYSDKQSVVEYLCENPTLFSPILTFLRIVKQLVATPDLGLELFEDIEEGWNTLFIIIKQELTLEDALNLEKYFWDNWYKDLDLNIRSKLNFTVEV